jgi:hypothetical protein
MTDTLTAPTTEAAVVAPAIPVVEALDPKEQASIQTPAPVPADDPAASISEASRALREKALTQPRNPDGTFTTPEGTPPVTEATPAAPTAPESEAPAPEPVVEAEPAVFVLKGDQQRGESDIELDITGLPPEVVARLELNETRGMKRKEYESAMARVEKLRGDLDAFETEISVDPVGVVLNHLAPAKRLDMSEVLLLEHWDALAPLIESLWQDEAGRMRRLTDLKTGVQSRRTEVATTVQAARAATAVKSAVAALVPETADESTAAEFYATSIALLQNALSRGETVAPDAVPTLLAAHRRRFFAADAVEPANTPPARPKLAVRSAPSPTRAAVTPSPTTVLSQDAIRAQTLARTAALATAHAGAGAGAVERPGPGANATIEEASRFLRAQKGR